MKRRVSEAAMPQPDFRREKCFQEHGKDQCDYGTVSRRSRDQEGGRSDRQGLVGSYTCGALDADGYERTDMTCNITHFHAELLGGDCVHGNVSVAQMKVNMPWTRLVACWSFFVFFFPLAVLRIKIQCHLNARNCYIPSSAFFKKQRFFFFF